jgi:hypothetical protein
LATRIFSGSRPQPVYFVIRQAVLSLANLYKLLHKFDPFSVAVAVAAKPLPGFEHLTGLSFRPRPRKRPGPRSRGNEGIKKSPWSHDQGRKGVIQRKGIATAALPKVALRKSFIQLLKLRFPVSYSDLLAKRHWPLASVSAYTSVITGSL